MSKAWCTPVIITRKNGLLVDSERVCALRADAERTIHNVERMIWESGGGSPSRRRQGGLGAEPPAFGDFYNFLMKIIRFWHI